MVKFMELKSSLFVILLKLYVTTNYIICNVYDYEWYITEHGKLGLSKYKLKNIMTKIYFGRGLPSLVLTIQKLSNSILKMFKNH